MFSISVLSQTTIDEVLNKYNDNSVPYINVDTLKKNAHQALILDAREIEEFEVSHLQDAQHIGFKNFNYSMMYIIMVD